MEKYIKYALLLLVIFLLLRKKSVAVTGNMNLNLPGKRNLDNPPPPWGDEGPVPVFPSSGSFPAGSGGSGSGTSGGGSGGGSGGSGGGGGSSAADSFPNTNPGVAGGGSGGIIQGGVDVDFQMGVIQRSE